MEDISQISVGDPSMSVNEYGTVDYAAMNKGVYPIFSRIPIKDEAETARTGVAKFNYQEVVLIRVAGDMNSAASHPVDDRIKERFAEQYAKWKAGNEERHIEGTPLRQWPMLSSLQVAEFESIGVYSVEHVAGLSDTNIGKIQDGRLWRTKAAAWLASAKDNAVAVKFATENEELRNKVEELRNQLADLASRVAEDERRAAGRPRKDAA